MPGDRIPHSAIAQYAEMGACTIGEIHADNGVRTHGPHSSRFFS
jgi:hypothetical protein